MSVTITTSDLCSALTEDVNAKVGASGSSVDLVCVGFGLSSIAIAAALADCNPDGEVCFFERQSTFSWSSANVLPENKIRTSFLRDLITTKNPRSKYTFVNYLHSTNQLVAFTNASSLQPTKLVMGQYLTWVAKQIHDLGWVSYGRKVLRIEPLTGPEAGRVSRFAVHERDMATGKRTIVYSKKVIVATGSSPHIPQVLSDPQLVRHVMHTTECASLFSHNTLPLPDIAVIGGSQEGAEVYEYLQEHYGGHHASLFIEDSALRPNDNTAFTQTVADVPESNLAAFPPELRQKIARGRRSQQDAYVTVELLKRLYDMDYAQKIREKDPSKWHFRIEPLAQIIGAEVVNGTSQPRVRLHLKNPRTGVTRKSDRSFDIIVAATGYRKGSDPLLSSMSHLLDGNSINVDRDYKVTFKRGTLQVGCGIWSLTSLEDQAAHDEVFIHLAEQGQRVANSVIALLQQEDDNDGKQLERLSML